MISNVPAIPLFCGGNSLRRLGAFIGLTLLISATGCFSELAPSSDVSGVLGEQESESRKAPNIVLLLIDDMGVNDLSLSGNTAVRTPNIDALASRGIRFTRNYVDSTCTATRVGVLTGLPPATLGFRPNQLGISPEVDTLADLLQGGGYTTHHVGKWHLGTATRLAWPLQQGFDSFYGFLSQFLLRGPHKKNNWLYGPPTYIDPWLQEDNNAPARAQGHLSELLISHVESLLDSKQGVRTPWFINFWTYAPHDPVQPKAEFSQRYPDTAQGKYLAFIEQLDATVGRVVSSLERNGLIENTLLLVASDNGGTNKYVDNNAPYKGAKTTYLEGGVRTPLIVYWPGYFEGGTEFDGIVTYFDYLPTLLAAAGLEVPESLAGRDLVQLQHSDSGPKSPLFWEMSNSAVHSWGVLSDDGQWRMSQFFVGEPTLNHLAANPWGDVDVLPLKPEKATVLLHQYQLWRQEQRQVHYDYKQIDTTGRARLSGQALQRNPGFAGHTIAIGVTPNAHRASSLTAVEQVIAYQKDQWQLYVTESNLVLDINGIVLRAKAPEPGRCSAVVVSSHFVHSYISPKRSRAMIELYVDSVQVAQTVVSQPSISPDSYASDTFIGWDQAGGREFDGTLSRPFILNERLVANETVSPYLDNGIDTWSPPVCP